MYILTISKYMKEKSKKQAEAAKVNKPGMQLSLSLHRKNLTKMKPSTKKSHYI